MKDVSVRTSLRRKAIALLLAIALLGVGAHLWLNTNAFGRDEACGGLVPTDSAAAVFSSSGRVSDGSGPDTRPDDRLAFTCTLESSSFLPWTDTERIRISAGRERGDFPFTDDGRWPNPAAVSFFSGGPTGAVGAVGDDHGWVFLPGACTTAGEPAIVEGYAPEGSDPVKLARLLTDVANRAAEGADCRGKEPLRAPAGLAAPAGPRPVRNGAVCGLADLEFPVPGQRTKATERMQEHIRPTWACEIAGYATYAVTQEPQIVNGIRSSPGFKEQSPVAGRRVSGFDPRHVVADCAGTPTYFSLEFGPSYNDAVGTPGTLRMQDLFDNFVESVGKRIGC
ncbi:hypothetical protein [Streptomyces sp. NPDC048623]|uniref:hypothetical protein n=1 Tax=Streptomyces sp. NPDC048623 TaxID=3155761 RepID=UPI003427090B